MEESTSEFNGETYYRIASLPDERLKKYLNWKINKIIIYCQFFFILYVLLYVILSMNSKSYYYWIFYGPIPLLHLYATFLVLFRKNTWSTQDTRRLLKFNFSDMCTGFTSSKTNFRPFTTFVSFIIILWFYSWAVYMKPLNQYIDLTAPPTNTSSCTKEYLVNTGNAYNPNGFFDYYQNYSDNIMLKFCAMDQTYAYPNLYTSIVGYVQSPLSEVGVEACKNPKPPFTNPAIINRVNGYADTSICLNKTTGNSASYNSPVLGLLPPISTGSINPNMVLCKGNTDSNVCISPDGKTAYNSGTCPTLYRIGKPKKICPVCLNYWRSISGDINGPPGYSHCTPYSPEAYSTIFCFFCPGRGYGFFKDELYTKDQLLQNLYLSTSFIILIFIEYLIVFILVGETIPDIQNPVLHKWRRKE